MNNWVLFVRKVLAILLSASRWSWHREAGLYKSSRMIKKRLVSIWVLFSRISNTLSRKKYQIQYLPILFFIRIVLLLYALYDFVIHWCEFCFDCFLELVCGCLCEANGAHSVRDFWICSNSGFVHSLGLFVFFRFDLVFLRSEQSERSPLGNFWVFSNSRRLYPEKWMSFVWYGS